MKNRLVAIFSLIVGLITAQQQAYYQQEASYKMEIDVDAANFSYHGNQEIKYTNNSPDELSVVYFHLYWNAFKPNSLMDQRVQNQGKNADGRLTEFGNSKLASIPKKEEGSQTVNWIKQNGKLLKFEVQETIMKVYLNEKIKPNSTTTFTMDWDSVVPKQIRRSGRNNREGVEMTMTQWFPKLAEYDYDGWATFDYIGREFHAPFSNFDVTIKIDKNYVIGAGGVLENPTEVKGYTENPTIKTDKNDKATWRFTAKNILDFAWAADKDYSVETFIVPDGPTESHTRNKNYQFWQYGNHAEEIYSLHFMWDKLNYIHLNPIRAGIVEKAQHYIYSSASNYTTGKGLVNVELADNPVINTSKTNEFWKYSNYDE